jgi:hypothetical protein
VGLDNFYDRIRMSRRHYGSDRKKRLWLSKKMVTAKDPAETYVSFVHLKRFKDWEFRRQQRRNKALPTMFNGCHIIRVRTLPRQPGVFAGIV